MAKAYCFLGISSFGYHTLRAPELFLNDICVPPNHMWYVIGGGYEEIRNILWNVREEEVFDLLSMKGFHWDVASGNNAMYRASQQMYA